MTGTAVKKKRFEGLTQFQEPLRQALVCIQAARTNRFATAVQSEFVKERDTPELSHFLLTSDGSAVGEIPKGTESRHLLMAIEQIEDDQLEWKTKTPGRDVKISAWLNSGDPLACHQLYLILAAAASEKPIFDLHELSPMGTITTSFADSMTKAWMDPERTALFKDFEKDSSKIFKPGKTTVSTDGCTVSLLIEGETTLSQEKACEMAMKHLKKSARHLVIVHYISGPKPRLQCAFLTPMRLPLKELQTTALKGFVLLHDIKDPVKLPKSVLAS